jgi:hypothetical protein
LDGKTYSLEDAIPKLVDMLRTNDFASQRQALWAIARFREALQGSQVVREVEALYERDKQSNPEVAEKAFSSLFGIMDPSSASFCRKVLLSEKNPLFRTMAARWPIDYADATPADIHDVVNTLVDVLKLLAEKSPEEASITNAAAFWYAAGDLEELARTAGYSPPQLERSGNRFTHVVTQPDLALARGNAERILPWWEENKDKVAEAAAASRRSPQRSK